MPDEIGGNPELRLIETLAARVEADEDVIDALGSGSFSLEDLERWHERRASESDAFIEETARLIALMRSEGFASMMSAGEDRRRRREGAMMKLRTLGLQDAERLKEEAGPHAKRFYLDFGELGFSCRMRFEGSLDDVLDSAVDHLRHEHGATHEESELRDALAPAVTEVQRSRRSLSDGALGDRSEEQVSDEAVNQTRSSGYASA